MADIKSQGIVGDSNPVPRQPFERTTQEKDAAQNRFEAKKRSKETELAMMTAAQLAANTVRGIVIRNASQRPQPKKQTFDTPGVSDQSKATAPFAVILPEPLNISAHTKSTEILHAIRSPILGRHVDLRGLHVEPPVVQLMIASEVQAAIRSASANSNEAGIAVKKDKKIPARGQSSIRRFFGWFTQSNKEEGEDTEENAPHAKQQVASAVIAQAPLVATETLVADIKPAVNAPTLNTDHAGENKNQVIKSTERTQRYSLKTNV